METYQQFIAKKKAEKLPQSVTMKDVGREGSHEFEKVEWTFMVQHNLKNKVFVIERLKRVKIHGKTVHKDIKIGDVEYRFGYFIVGKIGMAKNKWWWGQSCPLIPHQDFAKLLKKAKKEGTLLA